MLRLVIVLLMPVATGGALWATAKEAVMTADRVWLAILVGGLVVGNLWLLRSAFRTSRIGTGWMLLKALLFNAGWTLALGLLLTAPKTTPLTTPSPEVDQRAQTNQAEVETLRQTIATVETRIKEAKEHLNATEKAAAEQQEQRDKEVAPYNEMLQILGTLTTQLDEAEKRNSELSQYTSPLRQQVENTRKTVTTQRERIQQQPTASGNDQSEQSKEYNRLQGELYGLERQLATRSAPPAATAEPAPMAPVLPPVWRYLLAVLGFLATGAGLILADETLLRPLMHIFPFLKSEERRRVEKAEALFQQVKQLLRENKVSEALPLCDALETERLTPADRQEARFYHAYATFDVEGAEAALPLLKRQHTQSRYYLPSAYFLAYAHLETEQYEQARIVWQQVYNIDPDYLETRHHYSTAVLSRAQQFIAEARVNDALPLFKIVRELGVHADAVPEGLQNARLMEAIGKLRNGDYKDAATIFAQVEKQGNEDDTTDGARLAALGKLGLALVEMREGRADETEQLLTESLDNFHQLTGVEKPEQYSSDDLLKPISHSTELFKLGRMPAGNGDQKENNESDEASKAAPSGTTQERTLLRDLYFLQAMARLMKWSRAIALDQSDRSDTASRDLALASLRLALFFDKTFSDALGVYGFLLFFHSRSYTLAVTFLKQARTFGFDDEALAAVLDHAERISQVRIRSRTQILDRLREYFTNDEVPRELKEELLKEEAIRRGYEEYVGEIKIEEIAEHQPTLADLLLRSTYLQEEIDRIVREMKAGGTEQEKLITINQAMDILKKRNEEIANLKSEIEKDEKRVLRESGVFVLSQEF
jgi:tetratricopeptide (TPR) repeat protein